VVLDSSLADTDTEESSVCLQLEAHGRLECGERNPDLQTAIANRGIQACLLTYLPPHSGHGPEAALACPHLVQATFRGQRPLQRPGSPNRVHCIEWSLGMNRAWHCISLCALRIRPQGLGCLNLAIFLVDLYPN
jgi:hypothetical protein